MYTICRLQQSFVSSQGSRRAACRLHLRPMLTRAFPNQIRMTSVQTPFLFLVGTIEKKMQYEKKTMPIIKRLPFIYKSMLLSQATGSKEEVAVLRQEWCDALVIALNKAGCSMIKFGQWISMRPDMFPADLIHVHYPLPVTPSYSYGLSSSSSSILYPCLFFLGLSFLLLRFCFFFCFCFCSFFFCVCLYIRDGSSLRVGLKYFALPIACSAPHLFRFYVVTCSAQQHHIIQLEGALRIAG